MCTVLSHPHDAAFYILDKAVCEGYFNAMCCVSAAGGPPAVNQVPYGYVANSPSDMLLFTNPLVQGTLPNDWEDR